MTTTMKVPLHHPKRTLLTIMLHLEPESCIMLNKIRDKYNPETRFHVAHHWAFIPYLKSKGNREESLEKLLTNVAAVQRPFDIQIDYPFQTSGRQLPSVRLDLKSNILLDLRQRLMSRIPASRHLPRTNFHPPRAYAPSLLIRAACKDRHEADHLVGTLKAECKGMKPLKATGLLLGDLEDYITISLSEATYMSRWKYFPFKQAGPTTPDGLD